MEINLNEKTNLEFALSYARKGWYVFPVYSMKNGACSCGNTECKNPGKHPRTKHGLNDASKDEQQISQWWQETPDANIGIRTGEISGISVLDIDPRHGGFESIKAFSVPNTLISNTGGNGKHHIFKYDEKIPNSPNFKPGIDFRSDGGYIVAPPSNHKSGKEYLWVDLSVEPVPAPDWMKIKGKKKAAVQSLTGTIQEGGRNAYLMSLAGSMRRRGASQEAIEQGLLAENKDKCNPPLDESEVLNIARSAARYEPENEEPAMVSGLLSQDQINQIKSRIGSIPKDTDPTDLPTYLNPILEEIARINIAQGDALLHSTIKEHFGWNNGELATYDKLLKGHRKDTNNEVEVAGLGKEDLLKKLDAAKDIKLVHPAQDYIDGQMIFSVLAQDTRCIVTTNKDIFPLEAARSAGFNLKHDSVDEGRFSPKGLSLFLKGEYKVNIAEVYQKVYDYIRRFIVFSDEKYLTYLTLWVIGTYVFMVFRYFPYVWLNAEKGSGKTLLMDILSEIAYNGDLTTNPTESVIFRDISNNLLTLFIDEVERLRKREKDIYGALMSILNVGFCKTGAAKRSEKNGNGSFSVKSYNVYSPKMFAGIAEIDDVLQDRTVRIELLRKKAGQHVERYKESKEILDLQQGIRDDLYVFALTNGKALSELYNSEGEIKGLDHLTNRELDIWEPIFLLANVVDMNKSSMNLIGLMEDLSKQSLKERQSDNNDQNETCKILSTLRAMFEDSEVYPVKQEGNEKEFIASEVLSYFRCNEGFDWMDKTHLLTRRLKRVHIKSEQRRINGIKQRVYIIDMKDFEDLCERYIEKRGT